MPPRGVRLARYQQRIGEIAVSVRRRGVGDHIEPEQIDRGLYLALSKMILGHDIDADLREQLRPWVDLPRIHQLLRHLLDATGASSRSSNVAAVTPSAGAYPGTKSDKGAWRYKCNLSVRNIGRRAARHVMVRTVFKPGVLVHSVPPGPISVPPLELNRRVEFSFDPQMGTTLVWSDDVGIIHNERVVPIFEFIVDIDPILAAFDRSDAVTAEVFADEMRTRRGSGRFSPGGYPPAFSYDATA